VLLGRLLGRADERVDAGRAGERIGLAADDPGELEVGPGAPSSEVGAGELAAIPFNLT
jgi:hypothetical protein